MSAQDIMAEPDYRAAEDQYLDGIAEGLLAEPVYECPTCGSDMAGNWQECEVCWRDRQWVLYGPGYEYLPFVPVEVAS